GVKAFQAIVNFGQPLRHSIVIGVFRLGREFEVVVENGATEPSAFARKPAIRSNPHEIFAPVGDEPKRNARIGQSRLGGTENRTHKVGGHKRGAKWQLWLRPGKS